MVRRTVGAALALVALLAVAAPAAAGDPGPHGDGLNAGGPSYRLEWPARRLWVGATEVEGIRIVAIDGDGEPRRDASDPVRLEGLTATSTVLALEGGTLTLPPVTVDGAAVTVRGPAGAAKASVPTLAGPVSLLPALLAIGLALVTRQVLLSLFGGVLLGAALLHRSAVAAFPRALDAIVTEAADADHMKIIMFTMLTGGMVGLITANGGTTGIVDVIARRAKTVRSGSLATWAMGLVVFFDDYASSLIIGTTMRPITDRLRISREKLSYMVDSTAAPISSLALVSTWIGYEVSVLGDAMAAAGIERDAYEVFLSGLPSRFYQLYALAFVAIVALVGKDFGPMLTAERRARRDGKVLRDGAEPLMDADLVEGHPHRERPAPRAWLAILPLIVLVGTVLGVLVGTGLEAAAADPDAFAAASQRGLAGWFGFILSNAASYDALVYGAAGAATAAFAAALAVGALTLSEGIKAFGRGLQAMLMAIVILCLAWSIGGVMDDLHAGPYVAQLVGEAVPPWGLGTVAFLLAALIAFATGTSWGTMAILFPIVIPVAAVHTGSPGFEGILLGSSSAVLAGAVFGDHCSPISDTTVLSSIASAADLLDHTRTQAPYALLCALVAIVLGYLPYGLGVPAELLLVAGLAALVVVLVLVGRRPEEP